jgi:hypothetical protein
MVGAQPQGGPAGHCMCADACTRGRVSVRDAVILLDEAHGRRRARRRARSGSRSITESSRSSVHRRIAETPRGRECKDARAHWRCVRDVVRLLIS